MRLARTILLFLVLGVIVNVAVAWGCSLCATVERKTWPDSRYWDYSGVIVRPADPQFGLHVWIEPSTADDERFDLRWRYGYGWPLIAFVLDCRTTKERSGSLEQLSPAVDVAWIVGKDRVLPLTPFWPGFIVNTLFYGAILFAMIKGPFILRRHLRKRRNQCLTCGYSLQGSGAGCPECGEGRSVQSPSPPR